MQVLRKCCASVSYVLHQYHVPTVHVARVGHAALVIHAAQAAPEGPGQPSGRLSLHMFLQLLHMSSLCGALQVLRGLPLYRL